MKLLSLLDKSRKLVTVDGIELYFKRLTWNELKAFQDFTLKAFQDFTEQGTDAEDQVNGTIRVCAHILEHYVSDEDGTPVIDPADTAKLPVAFCNNLVERFVESMHGGADEVKKK